jgi:hypothetical protein
MKGMRLPQFGLLMSEEDRNRKMVDFLLEEKKRMWALAAKLGAKPDPLNGFDWCEAFLLLARQHVPELKLVGRVGAPTRWTVLRLMMLGGEIERYASNQSTSKAVEIVSKKPLWRRFLASFGEGFSRNPPETLRAQVNKNNQKHLNVGRNAYLMCVHEGKIDEWASWVEDALQNNSQPDFLQM